MFSLKKIYLRTLGKRLPSDVFAYRHPVSVKGICLIGGRLVLLKNERNEWDLPGGKLSKGEAPEDCLIREFREELGIDIHVDQLLKATQLRIRNQITVFVLLYRCHPTDPGKQPRISDEHFDLGCFSPQEAINLNLPPTYRQVIEACLEY